MKFKSVLAAVVVATLGTASTVAQAVEIEVGYPYSALFDVTFERMMPAFKKAHPDIDVKFRATYDNYETPPTRCCEKLSQTNCRTSRSRG